jgi:hypothetical protein
MEIRKFTNRKSNNTILPIIQPDNTVIFEENSKAIELEETFFKGKHLNINQFDQKFYDEVVGEYITMTLSDDEGEDDYYSKEISMDELEGAVSRLKIDSAPGPDNIFSKLLYQCRYNSFGFSTINFYQKLERRILTQIMEKGKCKISKKNPGKPNYNNPSSYRPLSLTSIIGKLMERIITSRLEEYVETNIILD